MNSTVKKVLQFIVFVGLGVLILFLLYRSVNNGFQEDCALKGIAPEDCNLFQKLWDDLGKANIFWLLMANVAFLVSNINRAIKWKYLLEPLGYSIRTINGVLSIYIGYFANLGFPRAGEVLRAGYLSRFEKVPVEKGVGTVAVDRLIDMCVFALFLVAGILLEGDVLLNFLRNEVSWSTFLEKLKSPWFLAVVAGLIFGLILYRKWQQNSSSTGIAGKIKNIISGLIEGFQSIGRLKKIGPFILQSLLIWAMYFVMTYMGFKAFAFTSELSLSTAVVVFIFGNLGMLVPSPGGMGSYHAMVMWGLALYGISQDDGFSFSMILFFSIQLISSVGLGILALILMPLINRKYVPKRAMA